MKRLLLAALALLVTPCAFAQYATVTGTLQASNGLTASNYTISFKPSQWGFIAGTGVMINTTTFCATSTDGTVVGIGNPLVSSVVTPAFVGTLGAGNYFIEYAWQTSTGTVTLVSPESTAQLTSTGELQVPVPTSGVPAGVQYMNVYIGTSSGSETYQGQIAAGGTYLQNVPLISGSAVPATNNTVCKQVANDAIWPVGTGYTVALTDTSGNTLPGYPMMWQLLGPNTTINVSNGLPYYHGVVTYPVPVLASPLNHATQSISGPLSLTNYNLVNVGRLGVGTGTPGWAIDASTGLINSGGLIINGTVGTSGKCLASDGTAYRLAVSCSGGGGGGVSIFTAPSASWPSWLVPTVTNATTTPNLAVAAGPIPNSALQNSQTTVNGVPCSLGATCAVGVSLPSATDANDTVQVNPSGVGAILTPANTGTWEAVQNGGADNTGAVDASSIINTKLTALCAVSNPVRIHLAAGTYTINSGILISATSSTCKGIVIEGDGSNNTILQTTCSGNSYGIWYNNTTNSGEHFNGPSIRHLQVKGTGGTACTAGIRLTQTAGFQIDDVIVTGFSGQTYATGTITTSGTTVTGVGTTFSAAMVHGFIEVSSGTVTTRAEVCGYGSVTSLTLCSNAFPTGALAGSAYALVYGGDGIALDGGFSWTQYGTIKDAYLTGNLIGLHAWGSTTGGVSRVAILGKRSYISPNPSTRLTDSVGVYLGKGSDTFDVAAASNNQAACFVLESSHGDWVHGECEDNATYAPVTTCNGGVATQACTVAAEASSDTNGHGWSNTFNGLYQYLTGTVFQFDNATGASGATILGDRVITVGGGFLTHFYFYGTTGCPANASGIPVIVSTFDCNHQLVAQTVN